MFLLKTDFKASFTPCSIVVFPDFKTKRRVGNKNATCIYPKRDVCNVQGSASKARDNVRPSLNQRV